MKSSKYIFLLLFFLFTIINWQNKTIQPEGINKITTYTADPSSMDIQFFWKDKNDKSYKTFDALKQALAKQQKRLFFAMNGGMFHKNLNPVGLYIERGKVVAPLDSRQEGYGNFYLQPNGIFYVTDDHKAGVCTTEEFDYKHIKYATQSGPMLLINDSIHPAFRKESHNLNIRNGVGILPDGKILFAITTQKINLYNFASFFKEKGCKNALYLDGFVSRMYLATNPQKIDNSEFGVIIAIVE